MSKRSTLSDALRHASGKVEPTNPSSASPAAASPADVKTSKIGSRRGLKTIAGFYDPAVSRQIRQIALEEGTNIQELLREAINDLFEKRGKSRIA
jgi:hypothetical protein